MLNKPATISTQEQAVARILRVSTLYLSLAIPATGMAQLAAPLPMGAPAAIAVQPNEPKLIYKASGAKLTVEELEATQQKKLEEDFFKKAGYTSTPFMEQTLSKRRKLFGMVSLALSRWVPC